MDSLNMIYIILGLMVVIITAYCVFFVIIRKMHLKRLAYCIDEVKYESVRNEFVRNVFNCVQFRQYLDVSSHLVSNLAGYRKLDYLIKYFHMTINKDTLNCLTDLEVVTRRLYNISSEHRVPVRYVDSVVPVCVMSYTSPAGRSHRQSCILFDCNGILEIKLLVEKLLSNQNAINYQRKLMTPALRQQILMRDNYTCQCCRNSIHKEPNLLLEVDHIVPVSKGGKTVLENLQTLCWKCNRSKSNGL